MRVLYVDEETSRFVGLLPQIHHVAIAGAKSTPHGDTR